MPAPKGIEGAIRLRRRAEAGLSRGGRGEAPAPADLSAEALAKADALAVWRDRYLAHLEARNYSPNTLKQRRGSLAFFLAWAADRDVTRAGQVTRPMLEAYQRWLWRYRQKDGRALSWSTQHQKVGTLRDFFRWLTRQDAILHNPASELELPRSEHRLPAESLSPAEIGRLLAVPDTADALGVRDRTMLEVFYSTGLRRAELCRVGLTEVNLERRTLTVRRGKGKKDRVVPLGERACRWLQRYLDEVRPRLCLDTREPALFLTGYGAPFHPNVVTRMVTAWMQRAVPGRKGSCHLLRHTCATHMLEGGADIRYIQQLLGHESLETTAIYTEVSLKQLQEVHARCHPTGRLPAEAGESADLPSGAAALP